MGAATGKTFLADVELFVACSGSSESPKLLPRSTSRFWTHGIGNDYGHVGRYLISHPFPYARG